MKKSTRLLQLRFLESLPQVLFTGSSQVHCMYYQRRGWTILMVSTVLPLISSVQVHRCKCFFGTTVVLKQRHDVTTGKRNEMPSSSLATGSRLVQRQIGNSTTGMYVEFLHQGLVFNQQVHTLVRQYWEFGYTYVYLVHLRYACRVNTILLYSESFVGICIALRQRMLTKRFLRSSGTSYYSVS